MSHSSHRSSKGDWRQHHRVVVCLNVEPARLPSPKGYPRRSGEVSLSLVREEQLKSGVAAQRLWAYHHLHASMVQSIERMHELPLGNYPPGGIEIHSFLRPCNRTPGRGCAPLSHQKYLWWRSQYIQTWMCNTYVSKCESMEWRVEGR